MSEANNNEGKKLSVKVPKLRNSLEALSCCTAIS